ncbi:MAG TPA: helix-turn-helix transcriptional regulator [Thermoanaerobaculia bacterium]|nr:helix-turn-helix transcriptional regulator [Thermoanaerobaculia bacterium]
MKPTWFHILLALAEGDRHGAAITRDVLDLTAGSLRLWPATLYGSLEELREAELIEELEEPLRPEGESGRKRFYRLTAKGRAALVREVARLEGVVATARRRVAGGKAGRGAR